MDHNQVVTDVHNKEVLTIPRYGAWIWDARKGAPQVAESHDDLGYLQRKYGVPDDRVFRLPAAAGKPRERLAQIDGLIQQQDEAPRALRSGVPQNPVGSTPKKVTFALEQIKEMQQNMEGGCIACGATRDTCEPDAREYPCEQCGAKAVYGAQELLFMGLVV